MAGLFVFLGGGLGALLRWLLGALSLPGLLGTTFLVNILGSIILAILMFISVREGDDKPLWLLLFGTGFCGGFTTYSSFNMEVLQMLERGVFVQALMHVLLTVLLILIVTAATYFGLRSL